MKKMLKIQEISNRTVELINRDQANLLKGGGPFMTPNCPPPVVGGGSGLSGSGAEVKEP